MRFFKLIENGYIKAVGTGFGGIEITEAEYIELLDKSRNKPEAPEGHEYWITGAGEFALVEVEPVPEPTEATPDEALDILRGDMQ